MKRHIEKYSKTKREDVRQMILRQGKLKSKKIDQMISHKICINLIIQPDNWDNSLFKSISVCFHVNFHVY